MYSKQFTLIELMIVVAIIAIIAVIAIPGLVRARISANETSAISTLRATSTAQLQFSKAGLKDRDGDGVGEYGFYTEISGTKRVPIAGVLGQRVDPGFINIALGTTSAVDLGTANKAGYLFQIWLPVGDAIAAAPETGLEVDPVVWTQNEVDTQELRWGCYAWPTDAGKTGNKAFFVCHRDEILTTPNILASGVFGYSGNFPPTPSAGDVFDPTSFPPDLAGPFLLETPIPPLGLVWTVVGKS